MLINEIEVLRFLKHPMIITLYEVYEAADYVHLVIEYLKGGELFDKIQLKGSYSEGDAAKLMKRLLQTINYCHKKNVIHRDIKPENIILLDTTSDLDFKIVDFGLAVVSKPGTVETLRCGSPGYAAPEVLLKEGYNLKADIFSCGIILCFLYDMIRVTNNYRLTGTTPFAATTIEEILTKNRKCEVSTETEIWRNVSGEGKELVVMMTRRDPHKRITSEEALAHPWFGKDFRTAENLSSALENMRKHSKETLTKKDSLGNKSPLPQTSLLTSSPLLCRRALADQNESDSPLMSPSLGRPCKSKGSKASLFKVEKEGAVFPFSSKMLQDENSKSVPIAGGPPPAHEPSGCASEDDIPEETLSSETGERWKSIREGIKPFTPGHSDTRKLPVTPGSNGGSGLDFARCSTKPQSEKLKTASSELRRLAAEIAVHRTQNGEELLANEEEKDLATERLPLNCIAMDRDKSDRWDRGLESAAGDWRKGLRKSAEIETGDSEAGGESNKQPSVNELRRSLLSVSNK